MTAKKFEDRLKQHMNEFHAVVPFEPHDRLLLLDFTENNRELTAEIRDDTDRFIRYINRKLEDAGAKYGIGGYGERRTIYNRSELFDSFPGPSAKKDPSAAQNLQPSLKTQLETPTTEPRRLHLGIDIWGKPYTRVMAPLDGIVHSFAFNNAFGDYGTTIILSHQVDNFTFHTLYGHLSLNSITNMHEGDVIRKGDVFAAFGIPYENGHWPPHLHFQVIIDMKGMKGDYPGVCAASEKESYLENSPNPDIILQMMHFAK